MFYILFILVSLSFYQRYAYDKYNKYASGNYVMIISS